MNPAHERRAREIALELRPGLPVSISSDLVSSTASTSGRSRRSLNSYTQPQVIKYVDGLESLLGDAGFRGRLNIVRSDGGTMSAASTKERPVDIAFSGPSGGAVGAAYLARRMGVPNVLTFDMGGTSTDVALCRDGEVAIKREAQLGYYQFQARGADIHSVGAGGGSIACLDLAGALKVGPRSAGADPGPACYGRGGDGADGHRRQRRARPAAGRVETRRAHGARRRRGRAGRRDGRRAAGLDTVGRRAAIIDIANENMHAALRVVSVERGYDPRDFGLVAFGGAGPLHANALARLIGADPLIIPSTPGVLSAFGFLAADVQDEFARTYLRPAEETPGEEVLAAVDELIGEAGAWLDAEGVDAGDRVFDVFADCRYYRQDIQIPVALERTALLNGYAARLRGDFEGEHRRRYGFDLEANVEIATLRVVGRGTSSDVEPKAAAAGSAELAIDRHERVHFDGEWHDTPIYERTQLAPGHVLAGPAIIEQEDSTSVIEPGWTGTVDDAGNITVRRQG